MLRLVFILIALPAIAHDLYVMPSAFVVSKGRLLIALHNGDAFPESEVPMSIERLRDAKLFSPAGSSDLRSPRIDGNRVFLDAEVSAEGDLILAGRTAPNFIELTPEKFVAYLKDEGLTEVIDWRQKHGEMAKPGRERYSKYFKAIILRGAPSEYFRQSVGHTIEIVPEKNPYTLKAGEPLPVQVFFRGRPAAGLQVESAWATGAGHQSSAAGRTGPDGRIVIPIAKAGKYRLHALKMERCTDPKIADWESFWASLTFEIR